MIVDLLTYLDQIKNKDGGPAPAARAATPDHEPALGSYVSTSLPKLLCLHLLDESPTDGKLPCLPLKGRQSITHQLRKTSSREYVANGAIQLMLVTPAYSG